MDSDFFPERDKDELPDIYKLCKVVLFIFVSPFKWLFVNRDCKPQSGEFIEVAKRKRKHWKKHNEKKNYDPDRWLPNHLKSLSINGFHFDCQYTYARAQPYSGNTELFRAKNCTLSKPQITADAAVHKVITFSKFLGNNVSPKCLAHRVYHKNFEFIHVFYEKRLERLYIVVDKTSETLKDVVQELCDTLSVSIQVLKRHFKDEVYNSLERYPVLRPLHVEEKEDSDESPPESTEKPASSIRDEEAVAEKLEEVSEYSQQAGPYGDGPTRPATVKKKRPHKSFSDIECFVALKECLVPGGSLDCLHKDVDYCAHMLTDAQLVAQRVKFGEFVLDLVYQEENSVYVFSIIPIPKDIYVDIAMRLVSDVYALVPEYDVNGGLQKVSIYEGHFLYTEQAGPLCVSTQEASVCVPWSFDLLLVLACAYFAYASRKLHLQLDSINSLLRNDSMRLTALRALCTHINNNLKSIEAPKDQQFVEDIFVADESESTVECEDHQDFQGLPFKSFVSHEYIDMFRSTHITFDEGSPEDLAQQSVHQLMLQMGYKLVAREFGILKKKKKKKAQSELHPQTCDLLYEKNGDLYLVEAKNSITGLYEQAKFRLGLLKPYGVQFAFVYDYSSHILSFLETGVKGSTETNVEMYYPQSGVLEPRFKVVAGPYNSSDCNWVSSTNNLSDYERILINEGDYEIYFQPNTGEISISSSAYIEVNALDRLKRQLVSVILLDKFANIKDVRPQFLSRDMYLRLSKYVRLSFQRLGVFENPEMMASLSQISRNLDFSRYWQFRQLDWEIQQDILEEIYLILRSSKVMGTRMLANQLDHVAYHGVDPGHGGIKTVADALHQQLVKESIFEQNQRLRAPTDLQSGQTITDR